jgi:formamidopyrimidine-DNA glycosylase
MCAMPELPEVEHAAVMLRRWLGGQAIVRAEAGEAQIFRGGDRRAFARSLPGRTLDRVERKGKVLLLYFDGDVGVLSHLGMTGRWVRCEAGEARPPHSHARIMLSDGIVLHYADPRQFGRIAVHRGSELAGLPEVRALGPDPLVDGIDVGALHEKLARTGRAVKVALMDQAVLAGVGNIYATEALFRAKVHPARAARSLGRREVGRIARGIEEAFGEALKEVGGEMPYLWEGAHVENRFLVYDRAGEACPRCRREIEAMTIGGRTSAFCPRCQPAG